MEGLVGIYGFFFLVMSVRLYFIRGIIFEKSIWNEKFLGIFGGSSYYSVFIVDYRGLRDFCLDLG